MVMGRHPCLFFLVVSAEHLLDPKIELHYYFASVNSAAAPCFS
jgi:hypothetical protein